MFFKLKEIYALRGYIDIPYVVLNLKNKHIKKLSNTEFEILNLCDSHTDFSENLIINRLVCENIIIPCRYNEKINENQKYKFYNNRYLKTVTWSITDDCNYKCKHCFMMGDKLKKTNDLTLEECLNIVDQISSCGINEIYLSGGEPLIRKDFFDIVDAILEKNIMISNIFTNGSLINEDFLDNLKKRNISPIFSLSFDGIGYHDWMRGVEGAEKKFRNTIEKLKKYNFNFDCNMCVHKNNINVLLDSVIFLNKLGVNRLRIIRTDESPAWKVNGKNLTLSFDEYYKICIDFIDDFLKLNFNMLISCQDVYSIINKKIMPCSLEESCNNNTRLCRIFGQRLFISSDGSVLPCHALGFASELKLCNIKKQKLSDILNNSLFLNLIDFNFEKFINYNINCKSCEFSKKCTGGCRALSYALTGDFFSYNPSRCIFFKNGYYQKLKDKILKI